MRYQCPSAFPSLFVIGRGIFEETGVMSYGNTLSRRQLLLLTLPSKAN